MRRILLLSFFCMFLLFACRSLDQVTLLDDISSISISKSEGYGPLSKSCLMTYDKNDRHLTDLEKVLKEAKEKKHKIDVVVVNERPDYDLLINYNSEGTQGLHLVLGDEGEESFFMYIGREEDGFYVSPRETKILRDLIEQ